MNGYLRAAFLSLGLACILVATPAFAQTPASPPDDRSSAYYDFAMAHLYGELAGAYGNRGEYVNKAIDMYRAAIKADPSATYIVEELSEFYVQTGQMDKAMQEAENLLKANPTNNNARKILARIYSRQIGDPDRGRVDQAMLKNAIDQYQKITEQDPTDAESFSMLARLYRVSHDDKGARRRLPPGAQIDANDEDALNGLAMVFADRGDLANAIDLLKQVVAKNPDATESVHAGAVLRATEGLFASPRGFLSNRRSIFQTTSPPNCASNGPWTLYAAGRLDEALDAFQGLAAENPKNVALLLKIAELA